MSNSELTKEDNLEIVQTSEGIHTLYNKQVDEHYHSMQGSLQDNMLVFIKNGLLSVNKNLPEIKVLEMGFGTGLNAILTYRENYVLQKHIHYTTVEAFPLPASITNELNYFEYFGKPLQPFFQKMHACDWFENIAFGDFVLHKIKSDMLELHLDGGYDLIYYDAFSPIHQPELWTFEVLHKIYDACNRGAILVTSCTKGDVKNTLAKVGFKVEILQGPKGNSEMIKAVKNI